MKIDFIISDYSIVGCKYNPINLLDDPRGISGTDIQVFGNASILAQRGHQVRIFSRWTQPCIHDDVQFLDFDSYTSDFVDAVIAYHDGRCLPKWNASKKLVMHQTFDIAGGVSASRADLYLSATEYCKQYHESRSGGKWAVLPNACDLGSFKQHSPVKGRMIYHTDPMRGLHVLLKAMPEIKKRVPEAHLQIYGKRLSPNVIAHEVSQTVCIPIANRYKEIQKLLRLCGEYVTVFNRGYSRNEILKAVSEAAVFAYPSEPLIQCEVFPISVMECCKTGTPVVLSPADNIDELFKDAVSLVPAPPSECLDEFIEETVHVLSDDNYAKQLSDRGRVWAEGYSFEKTASMLESMVSSRTSYELKEPETSIRPMNIAFLLPSRYARVPINPKNIWNDPRGLTGSEISFIMYALHMTYLGHSVTIFSNFTSAEFLEKAICRPYEQWAAEFHKNDWDAVCAWLDPEPLFITRPEQFKLFNQQFADFNLCSAGWEKFVDILCPLSNSHANHMSNMSNFPKKNWRVMNNGVDTNVFKSGDKISGKVIWASSHDRGLHRLLEAWPRVKQNVPNANLHIFYDMHAVNNFMNDNNEHGNRARYISKALKILRDHDVNVHGSVSRNQICEEMASAEVLAYPLDPLSYTETFGSTVLEACASGCVPVICADDCFEELWSSVSEYVMPPYSEHKDEYMNKLISILSDHNKRQFMAEKCVEYSKQFEWTKLAKNLELTLSTRGKNGLPVTDLTSKVLNTEAIREFEFHGNKYKIACVGDSTFDHPSWFTFVDEQDVRNDVWNVKPDDVVLDIGAAYGSYSLTALAAGAEHVYAWSPHVRTGEIKSEREFFQSSLQLNGWTDKCTVYNYGLFNQEGWLDSVSPAVYTSEPRFNKEPFEVDLVNAVGAMVQPVIKVATLDDWMTNSEIERCDWIKIDVEGVEVEVLQGGLQFICKFLPNILVENHVNQNPLIEQQVTDVLINEGYRKVGTRPHHNVSHSLFVPSVNRETLHYFNVFNLHRDLSFKNIFYKAAYVCENHATWHVHEDEVQVRNSLWNISKGDVIFDVGADAGSYTLSALAMGASHVYAWSPQQVRDVLLTSLRLNNWESKCHLFDYGLYDKSGWLNINTQEFFNHYDGNDDNIIKVIDLNTLYTTMNLNRLDWMKIDVEGAEVEIIKGASKLINRYRPRLLIENHIFKRQTVCEEIHSFLSSNNMNYKLICDIPYKKSGWPEISHSLWIPSESMEVFGNFSEAHYG